MRRLLDACQTALGEALLYISSTLEDFHWKFGQVGESILRHGRTCANCWQWQNNSCPHNAEVQRYSMEICDDWIRGDTAQTYDLKESLKESLIDAHGRCSRLEGCLQSVLDKLEEVNHCCVPCDDHMDDIMEQCREALRIPSVFSEVVEEEKHEGPYCPEQG